MRILLVEEKIGLAECIAELLEKQNYTVDVINIGEEGIKSIQNDTYDLVILDVILTEYNSFYILKEFRMYNKRTPVVFLASKEDYSYIIYGLDLGADDCIEIPFNSDEFLARIRALLRRHGEITLGNILKFGNISLNHTLLIICGEKSRLIITKKEADLLEYLILNHGRILSKDMIIEKIWGYDFETENNSVEVYISQVRKKLKILDADVIIRTYRGLGYCLDYKEV